uniref:uncharacterized protein LOC122597213 n=1 Tax=Erigeron canadensis TaxID=72917 RepID=UPI001CB9380E|nr:uncharacterized protein LOC122597213 [Erigeron canadensis]
MEENTSPILLLEQPPQTSLNYWSNEETATLIEAYRNKWYYLKLAKLRGTHWQQIVDEVMARCNTHKTVIQCRRKMSDLKKRYHDELKRARNPKPKKYAWVERWVHFQRMDFMVNGYGLMDLHAKKEEDDDEQEEKEREDGENQEFYSYGIRAKSHVWVMDHGLDPSQDFGSGQGLGGGYVEGGIEFGKSEDGDESSDVFVEIVETLEDDRVSDDK